MSFELTDSHFDRNMTILCIVAVALLVIGYTRLILIEEERFCLRVERELGSQHLAELCSLPWYKPLTRKMPAKPG
jgi:hypothetical protein